MVLDFKAGIMLLKTILITKVIVQIGLVFGTISEKSEHSYVSQNWHKTQVFIFYNKEHSNEQIADCLGTILSPRFILTTASCIALSIGTSPSLQHAVITRIYRIVTSRSTFQLVTPSVTNWIWIQLVTWAQKNKSCPNRLRFFWGFTKCFNNKMLKISALYLWQCNKKVFFPKKNMRHVKG